MTPSLAIAPPAPLPSIRPAQRHRFPDLTIRDLEQVELTPVIVRRVDLNALGRQLLHQPAARNTDQFPRHCTQLPQRDLS